MRLRIAQPARPPASKLHVTQKADPGPVFGQLAERSGGCVLMQLAPERRFAAESSSRPVAPGTPRTRADWRFLKQHHHTPSLVLKRLSSRSTRPPDERRTEL